MQVLRLIYEPTINVIGSTTFKEPIGPKVNWVANKKNPMSDGERLAEYAGRLCYLSFNNASGRSTEDYITNILEQGHFSVIEHANVSLLLEGISRSCSHEIVRHRHFSFSQLSQRYVDESDAAFVVPPALIGDQLLIDAWSKEVEKDAHIYKELVDKLFQKYNHIEDKVHRRKVAREAARSLLPNATETKMVISGNLRTWRHFLELRTGEGAEREIRRLAIRILETLKPLAPTILADFETYLPADHQAAAKFKYRGS